MLLILLSIGHYLVSLPNSNSSPLWNRRPVPTSESETGLSSKQPYDYNVGLCHAQCQRIVRMKSILSLTCFLAVLPLVVGCVSASHTRLPSVLPRHPRVERGSYRFHDPFPDHHTGPDTDHRPTGYSIQRTQARTLKEGRATIDSIRPFQGPPPVQTPMLQYPFVVRP